ncbi:MAG: M6 family metalloprotease domain-containing protein [Prevotella sp.]|nr:M6 family metalloprotease domain-containing protein [Prevotella sp.]
MKTKFFITTLFLMAAIGVYAVPAKPGVKKTVMMVDGTTQELTLRGDEHFSFFTDGAGQYFMLRTDKMAERVSEAVIAEQWTTRKSVRQAKVSPKRRQSPRHIAVPTLPIVGKRRGLVILMEFPDCPFVTPEPQKTFQRHFNEVGYTEYGNTGSVKDYFLAQSYGQLDIDFDVVGPFVANNEMAYYGAHDENSNDARPGWLIAQGIDDADPFVNYRDYDWDGDGEVDQVFVIYAGYAEAQGADENTIWPHEWVIEANLGEKKVCDGVYVNTYGCTAELRGDGKTWGGTIDGIGSACHEFSHCLGLPDFYDTKGNNFGMGNWDVMCSGSYNNNSCTPAGYTSYERMYSGWLTPTEINTMTRICDMQPLVNKPEAYILYNEKNRNEYYLLENRQPVGFDQGLYGHGLLVVHVDFSESAWVSNSVNTSGSRQRMTIIPADGNLSSGSRQKLAGDPWPGYTGNTMLSNYTSPAATINTANSDGSKFMNKPIDNITENVESMTVSFVVCRPELAAPETTAMTATEEDAGSFTISWPAVSGAIGYEVELTTIGKAASRPEEALKDLYDFEKFKTASAGYSDLSSKLASYGLSGWTGSKIFSSPNKMRIGTSTASGYLRTPWWNVPESQDITVVLGVGLVKAGTPETGVLQLQYGNNGGQITQEDYEFEVTKDGKMIFHFTVRAELFRLLLTPKNQLYLNHLAIYDGHWTAKQLGYAESLASPRRAQQTVNVYQSQTNSLMLTQMPTNCRYLYRVRSLGEEGTFSQWNEQKTFEFSNVVGISDVQTKVIGNSRVYDLQGREATGSHKGIFIQNGRKVVR